MEATITKPNVQVVRDAFADFMSGNMSAVVNVCTDDVVWGSYRNPDTPFAGTYYGKEGVAEFFNTIAQNVDYLDFQPQQYVGDEDTVMVLGHHTGKVKSTGKTFDHDWCMHFRLRNGKIRHFFAFVDSRDQSNAYKN